MKRVVLALSAAVFWFSMNIYVPYFTPELLSLGVSATAAGLIVAMHSGMQLIARFPVGLVIGRRGKHKGVILLGMLLTAAGGAVMLSDQTPLMLGIGYMVSGLAGAMYVGFLVVFEQYYPPAQADKAMGRLSIVVQVGVMISFILGGFLYAWGGVKFLFLAAVISGLAGLGLSCFVQDVPMPKSDNGIQQTKEVIGNRQLWISIALDMLMRAVVFGTAFSFAPKLAQDIGAKGPEIGILNGLFGASSAISCWFITSRAGRRAGDVALCAAGFSFLCFYSASISFAKSVPLFALLQFIGGFGYASMLSIFTANSVRSLPIKLKSAGMGLYESVVSVGSMIGPVLVGSVADSVSYQAAFLVIAALAAAGIVLSLYAGRKGLLPKGTLAVPQRS